MHPLVIKTAKSENDCSRRMPNLSACERKYTLLERQRAKLVAMLAIHPMSKARRARLRARLANFDEMIELEHRGRLLSS